MNLQLVTGQPFTITCIRCGKKSMSNQGQWYADLNGKPFQDYYCQGCASFKTVKIEYTNNLEIITSVNPQVSDEDIRKYFKVGSIVNVGNGENDRLEKILKVTIL